MARQRGSGDPVLRQEMRETDALMLKYAEQVGAEREIRIYRRHVAAIDSSLPFRCRAANLPPGFKPFLPDDQMVWVMPDGEVELDEGEDND